MSDTPMTDAAMVYDDTTVDGVMDFARTLERELNAANERIKRLESESESRWMLAQSAIGSCAEMSSRIKRLEQAGDALYENSDPTRFDLPEANARKLKEQEAWRKAKEAKP